MFYFVENDKPNLNGECFFGGEYIFIKYSGDCSFRQIKADDEEYPSGLRLFETFDDLVDYVAYLEEKANANGRE